MPTAANEEKLCAPMVWTDTCVLPLAAAGVYPKTRVWGSKPENVHCSRATAPLKIELRRGCEESSGKTAAGSGVSFKYDPFGRRIYKSSSAGTSIYAYDGDNLIEEASATGAAVARYSQGLNIDEPLAMLRSATTSFYNADGLGSITSLSSTAGALAQTYTFDSFGKTINSSGSLTNPFQYTAHEFDPETTLDYYRARYYDPAGGRFMSEDLFRFDSGAPSLYLYVRNNPTNLIDPLGLWPIFDGIGWVNGIYDMGKNYYRMKYVRNWKNDDLYYHCMANCQASNQGAFGGGREAAGWISLFRTNVWGRVTEPDWRDDDKANKCGQQGGDCNKRCAQFIPPSSPGKPKFPGW